MPHNETFHAEPVIGAVPRLRGTSGRKNWSAKGEDARPQRLSLRVPGRIVARTNSPATPEDTGPAAAAAQGEPRMDGLQAPATARSLPTGLDVGIVSHHVV